MGINLFNNIYSSKKVLVTGNTGFKGSWLTAWLIKLNAHVYGISKDIPTNPSMFEVLKLEDKINHTYADINDPIKMKELIQKIQPDFLFHLAAQPIVSKSYINPLETFQTNVIGTANILDALKSSNHQCTAILISSDKCYENVEWNWGYREIDHFGGKDPYSASKGACEIIIHSYFHSFFKSPQSKVRLVSVRAGNVIGGGDWAEDRLIPDSVKAWSTGKTVEIRNPQSIRPWQHALEPLSGYLRAGEILYKDITINGEPFNFGPPSDQAYSVKDLLSQVSDLWTGSNKDIFINPSNKFHESGFLKLNCDKSLSVLQWKPALNLFSTIKLTMEWYNAYYNDVNINTDLFEITNNQIEEYISSAKEKKLDWIKYEKK